MSTYPKLHNATWPGVVGKGPESEPTLSLDVMLDLTAEAEVEGVRQPAIPPSLGLEGAGLHPGCVPSDLPGAVHCQHWIGGIDILYG